MGEREWKYSDGYIKVLDGIRAMAILIIAWYHIWQQSWLQPIKEVSLLSVFHCNPINFDWLVRTGSLMVDMLLLLSGFCLFLPYARSMVYGVEEPGKKEFYKRRVARIVPSYLVAILIALIVALANGEYADGKEMWEDLIPHLFFGHNFWEQSYIYTKLNGVLWTLAVEVQFYLIFPVVAKLFKRWMCQTYFSMVAISWMFINWGILDRVPAEKRSMWINQLPAMLAVYANGMLAAFVVVKLTQIFNEFLERKEMVHRQKERTKIGYFFTMLLVISVFVYYKLMNEMTYTEDQTSWQISNRFEVSMVYAMFLIGCVFAVPVVQKIFGNAVTKFLSGISFQLYIWHQYIALLLKNNHIPYWEGEQAPNITGDQLWIRKYFVLCWICAFLAAIGATYLIERPCSKWILKSKNRFFVKKKEK